MEQEVLLSEQKRLVEALRSSRPEGTIERSKLVEALRVLAPELCANRDLGEILQAAGMPGEGPVKCETFVSWLYSSETEQKTQSAQSRWPQLGTCIENKDLDDGTTVEFLTDVEGNWDYFVHFVSFSKILYWEGEDLGLWGPGTLRLRDNGMLVFGGDAPDNGPGDIRFVKTLLALKREYWSRVFIVLGNRDLNKLRLSAELAKGEDGVIFESFGGAYWEPYPRRTPDYATWLEQCGLTRGALSTLRWMLETNMHSPSAFRTRKYELALLHGKASDEDVLQNYVESVNPLGKDAWMLDLLRVGQLAVVLGDALFIHGGLHDDALGVVPGQASVTSSMQDWAEALNEWKDSQIRDFEQQPFWRMEGDVRKRGGEGLIDYGVPGGADDKGIVYHNPFHHGNPQTLSEGVERFLERSGIRRVLSGHQPHGESPTVVRHLRSGLLVITCDTSFSNMGALKLFNTANNRGDVVTMVRLEGARVNIEGVLKDGQKHGCTLHVDPDEDIMPYALVGRQLNDGSWVKTVLENGRVLAALGRRFLVSCQAMHPSKACFLLKPEYCVYRNGKFSEPLHGLTGEKLAKDKITSTACPGAEPGCADDKEADIATTQAYDHHDFDDADTYIIDGHGTIWTIMDVRQEKSPAELEQAVIMKVNEIIATKKRVIFATNDSNCSRRMFVDRLLKHGLHVCADDDASRKVAETQVISAAYTCAWFVKNAMIKKPFVLCSHTALLDELRAMGVDGFVATLDDDGKTKEEYFAPATAANVMTIIAQAPDVDAIVVGWDQQLTALKIAVAATYLKLSQDAVAGSSRAPIQIISCSCDKGGVMGITPGDFCEELGWAHRGIPAVGNGTMSRAVCSSAGEGFRAIDVGKPSEVLIEMLRRPIEDEGYGVNLSRAILVGDTLGTDIELANRSGMRSLLVLSGVTSRADLEREDDAFRIPTWVTDSVAHI